MNGCLCGAAPLYQHAREARSSRLSRKNEVWHEHVTYVCTSIRKGKEFRK